MEKYPNINILLNLPKDYLPKAEFVLRTYCYILRLNPKFSYGSHFEGADIYYGERTQREYPIRIFYAAEAVEFFKKAELYPLEKVKFSRFMGYNLPFLFSPGGAIFSLTAETAILRKDIVASGFYFLSCWHEYVLGQNHLAPGRVDYQESLQYRWDFTEIPVVDIYARILTHLLKDQLPEFVRDGGWRENHPFALSLSHDLDYWDFWNEQSLKEMFKYNLKSFSQRPLKASYKLIGHFVHKKLWRGPKNPVEKLLQSEKDLGLSSTFFLMACDKYPDARQNYIADLDAQVWITSALAAQDLALHGSPEAAFEPAVLQSELARLQELGIQPTGFRTHYLHFDYQKTFSILEQAGIAYDSTLGYWENIGFRAGTSFPFYPFNIRENRPFRVLEIPLIVMDISLYSEKAMHLGYFAARRALMRLLDTAQCFGCHISLLWHDTSFDPIDYPGLGALYWQVIRRALAKKAWVCTLNDIYEEWVNLSY